MTPADIIRRRRGLPVDDSEAIGAAQSASNNALLDGLTLPLPGAPPPSDVEAIGAAQTASNNAMLDNLRPGSVPAQVGTMATGASPPPQPDPEDVKQAAAMLGEQPAAAPGQTPPPPPMQDNRDADELHAAQEADRKSRLTAGMELAGRQLVGGITRTDVGQGLGAAPSQVPGAISAAESRRKRLSEAVAGSRQGRLDERQERKDLSEHELRQAKIADLVRGKQGKAGADDELSTYKDVMSKRYPQAKELINGLSTMKGAQDLQNSLDAELGRGTTIDAARIAAGATRSEARDVRADVKKTAAENKAYERSEDVPPGYEVSEGSAPGKETRRDFSKLVTSAERMKGLTAQMRQALKGTSGTGRVLDPAVRTKLQQLSTQIQIEAKDVAGLGALSGPDMALMQQMAADPTSIQTNLMVDLPTMLGQLDSWADNSVGAKTKASGIRRKAGAGSATKTVDGKTYKLLPNGNWRPVQE